MEELIDPNPHKAVFGGQLGDRNNVKLNPIYASPDPSGCPSPMPPQRGEAGYAEGENFEDAMFAISGEHFIVQQHGDIVTFQEVSQILLNESHPDAMGSFPPKEGTFINVYDGHVVSESTRQSVKFNPLFGDDGGADGTEPADTNGKVSSQKNMEQDPPKKEDSCFEGKKKCLIITAVVAAIGCAIVLAVLIALVAKKEI